MEVYIRRDRPIPWQQWRSDIRHSWTIPFALVEYALEWVAYALSNWRFVEVLEYLGRFGILVAVIFYFAESGDRLKQKHYQAWQVINSAEGKGGNGGRIEALQELNADGVSLIGVNLSNAFLMGVCLPKAHLARSNFDSADARSANLSGANLADASLRSANFRFARFQGASLTSSILDEADLTGADLHNADLSGASLENADLRNANLEGLKWRGLQNVKGANIQGVRNAPSGFVDWALSHGAVEKEEE
ncbi:MAG TPA: pentapeptide repeat-containing protein [Candidatus Eremiobacteraceae bacterium]|nr:pentapeptide repeat-containing protein [Candidatus Eremiobacteraceae bacterium]